jgi:hypothetical protein
MPLIAGLIAVYSVLKPGFNPDQGPDFRHYKVLRTLRGVGLTKGVGLTGLEA